MSSLPFASNKEMTEWGIVFSSNKLFFVNTFGDLLLCILES